MTGDEAIDILRRETAEHTGGGMVVQHTDVLMGWINAFVKLGMLKLDKPKSLRTKAIDALFKNFGGHDVETIFDLLEKANLKIVEK